MPVSHQVYGLQIEVNIALPSLPIQSKQQAADVKIKLKEAPEFISALLNSSSKSFYSSGNSDSVQESSMSVETLLGDKYFGFFYGDGVRFAVEREGREIWADWPDGYSLEDACTYLIGPVISFALRLQGATCLHASAIAIDDYAIALVGPPGAGKSTTAAAFARLGYPVLTDDVVVLADRGDQFFVQSGYPRVNLWPDSVCALFGSKDALPHITPTWDKQYLALDQNGYRFQTEPLPLGAIYILSEREAGLTTPIVEELAGSEAFTMLVANTYVNYLLNDEMRLREFDMLSRVMAGTPVRRVRPTGDPSKVFELCEAIAADARRITRRNAASTLQGSHFE